MAKRTKKLSRSHLKLEALEQRQLLAGGFTDAQGQQWSDLTHYSGNVYDQVLMKSSTITVNADAGQITRVSFLDLSGDIIQAEFSGAGMMTISLDPTSFKAGVAPEGYLQTGIQYVQGLASFKIEGSDSSTHFAVKSLGSVTAETQGLFDATHTGGSNHIADVARLNIIANPANANGSIFGSIRAGNAIFSAESGVVGISATDVHVQDLVRIGDIDAKGSATPMLVFGEKSQFGSVEVAGGDLQQSNGKAINNTASYGYQISAIANVDAGGTEMPAVDIKNVPFTDRDPLKLPTSTLSLTTAIDAVVGTSGNDTVQASHTTPSPVVSALDSVDGGAGNDLLTISDATGTAPINGLKVTNVENLEYVSIAGLGASDVLNTTAWTGLTNTNIVLQDIVDNAQAYTAAAGTAVTITSTGVLGVDGNVGTWAITGGSTVKLTNTTSGTAANIGTDTVTVTGVNGTTSVEVTQAGKKGTGTFGAVNVTDWANGGDAQKAGTISSVTLNGVDTASTITSNALTTLSLTKVTAGITVTDNLDSHAQAANRTTLAVALNESNTSITDTKSTIKQLDITTSGKDSTLDVDAGNVNVLTTINVSGEKRATLTGTDGDKLVTLTSADAPVTVTVGENVAVTTAAGADVITLSAATKKAVAVGAGDDKVTAALSNDGTLGSGGSIDGGEGTDTLSLTFDSAKKASEGTTFQGTVTGFEKIELNAAGTGGEVNLHNLDDINQVVVSANIGNAFTLKGLTSGASVTYTEAQGANTTIDIPTSAIQNESVAVKISAGAAKDIASLETGAIVTVNLNSDDTANNPGGGFKHVVGFSSNVLKTINVTGDAGVNIDTTGTGVTTVDASGITKGGLQVTTGALSAAATITGSAGDDTIVATAATKAVTVSTGNGANSVTISNAQANTVTGGSGIDTITVGSGNNTITGGGGADVINLNTTGTIGGANLASGGDVGSNTVDAGDGNDIITVGKSVGQTTITLGGGDDTVAFTAVPGASGYYTTIVGAGNNDKVSFAFVPSVGTPTWNGTKIELGQGVSFADYVTAAAAGDGAANSIVRWFQYGGDTFLVLDQTDGAYSATADMVVRLSGNLDLSATGLNPSIAAGVLTI